MVRPVSLSVHRNTLDRRRRHEARDLFKATFNDLMRRYGGDIEGFSITVVGRDGISTRFMKSENVPVNLWGEFVKRDIEREIGMTDANLLISPPDED